MLHITRIGCACALLLAAVQLEAAETLSVQGVYALPQTLPIAVDVRWAGDSSVYLAGVDEGTWRANFAGERLVLDRQVDQGKWTAVRMPSIFLGGSSELLALGSGQGYAWKVPANSELGFSGRIDWINDFDSRNGEVAFIGQRRGTDGAFCFDNGLAWRGPLKGGLAGLEVLVQSKTRCEAMNVCGDYSVGTLRFLDDGSLFVIPGVEGGAMLFDRRGALVQEWALSDLGIDSGCDLRHGERISGDDDYARAFLNSRVTAEEILPLSGGRAGVVVRQIDRRTGLPHWELLVLTSGIEFPERISIPIEVKSPHSMLRGDARGDEIAFLVVGNDVLELGQNFSLVRARLVSEARR